MLRRALCGSHASPPSSNPPPELPDVRTSAPVASIRSLGPEGPVELKAGGGAATTETFDAVLLATHSDISLRMLGEQVGPQRER